jgi:putative component of toxin-antitoxin plasmid stabilization module
MSKFALTDIPEVKGLIRFKKLVIDGVCQYDQFCDQIRKEGNLSKQLIGLLSNLNQVANLKRLPKQKFRDITPANDPVKEFEIKKGDRRLYVFKDEAGHIIVFGGKKSTQNADIGRFRSIKRQYLESKK